MRLMSNERSKYMRRWAGTLIAVVTRNSSIHTAIAITPDDPGPAALRFTLNSGQSVKPISPWIYGSNSANIPAYSPVPVAARIR